MTALRVPVWRTHADTDAPILNLTGPNFPGAACAEADGDAFFPDTAEDARYARQICGRCPARNPCLQWALDHNEAGIWGGTTRKERQRLKRKAA